MYKMLLRVLLFLFLITFTGLADDTEEKQVRYADRPNDLRPAYGLFGHIGYNVHKATMTNLPGIPSCCPVEYSSGGGFAFGGGLFYSFPISENMEISLRATYLNLSGSMIYDEAKYFAGQDGDGYDGNIEHYLEGTVSSIGLTPLLGFRLSDYLTVSGGLRIGIMSSQYEQWEKITDPSWGVFLEEDARIRNNYSGDIPAEANPGSIDLALVAGIGYDLPLNNSHTLFLTPEAFVSAGLGPVADNWSVNSLYGGAAIKYSPRSVIPPKETLPPPPPPLPAPPPPPDVTILNASILAVSVDENGMEQDVSTIKVRETLSRKVYPLLNYIFFDENSDDIRNRYIRKTGMSETERNSFSVNSLYGMENIDVYYNVLNVVGRRMIAYPIANLTLNGYNSNNGAEKGNRDLSRRRAQKIKDYLVNEWGIGADRIKVTGGNLPKLPSNETSPDGQEENRRVEMYSDFDKIFESLTVGDTLVETNPPLLRFKPKVFAEIGIKSWKIVTAQESSGQLKVFEGEGDVPTMLEWDLKTEKQYVPRFDEPFLYQLEVVDNDNKKWESPLQKIPVQAVTSINKLMLMIDGTIKNDKEYDQYTLISFAYDDARILPHHLPIVAQAKQNLTMESGSETYTHKTDITGHADRTGDADRNLALSKRRALSTATAIGADPSTATGLGEADPNYDNNTPEGRFYNRSVQIDIQTTIELK